MKKLFARRFLNFGLFLFAFLAPAGVGAEEPLDTLRSTVEAAIDVVHDESFQELSLEDKYAEVREIMEDSYDLEIIVRRAMGRNWKKLREDQQAEVVELIKKMLVRTYLENMEGEERPGISYGDIVKISDKRVEVPATIKTKDQRYEVLYRFGRLKSGWALYDIVAEDISIVSNYREQFNDHFRNRDGAALIKRLKQRIEEGDFNEELKL
ncbi:MAG: phospholipid-binding protein MlaC [Opitutales bacterium]